MESNLSSEKLFEKYRPATFGDVLGQPKAVKQIGRVLQSGWGGRAYWISGASVTLRYQSSKFSLLGFIK